MLANNLFLTLINVHKSIDLSKQLT